MDNGFRGLTERMALLSGCVICFSGGFDSTVLLRNACESIPKRFAALFVRTPMNTERQIHFAKSIAEHLGAELLIEELSWKDMEGVERNGPDRCYLCKKAIYRRAREVADRLRFEYIVAGENADDALRDRPGRRAGAESGVICPLEELGIGRDEIESAVASYGLPVRIVKDTCMATRFPTNTVIDEYSVRFAEECENIVRTIAEVDQIRVRIDGYDTVLQTDSAEIARLEHHLPEIESTFMMKGLTVRIDRTPYKG